MKRKLEYLTDVSKLNNKEMNEKEMYKIRYQFISSPHIKEIILAMNPKAYDENKPEYANAILFFRSISANADEMARLQKQLNTYENGVEMAGIDDFTHNDCKLSLDEGCQEHRWKEMGYKQGAKDQREIDVKKMCDYMCDCCPAKLSVFDMGGEVEECTQQEKENCDTLKSLRAYMEE